MALAARFYKTRALAKEMINGGKVHYNGQRTKSSKLAEVGARIRLRQGYDEKEIVIKKSFRCPSGGSYRPEPVRRNTAEHTKAGK